MPVLRIHKYVIKCDNRAYILKRLYCTVIICEDRKIHIDSFHQLTEHQPKSKNFCQIECSQLTCYQSSIPLVSNTR